MPPAASPAVSKRPLGDVTQTDHHTPFIKKRRFDLEDLPPPTQPTSKAKVLDDQPRASILALDKVIRASKPEAARLSNAKAQITPSVQVDPRRARSEAPKAVKFNASKAYEEDEGVSAKPVQVSTRANRSITPPPPPAPNAPRATSAVDSAHTIKQPGDSSSETIVKCERDDSAVPPPPSKHQRPKWACLPRKDPVSR